VAQRKTYNQGAAGAALEAYAERKRIQAQFPSLYLHCYATARGVRLHAYVDSMDPKGKLHRLEIAKAEWRPSQVTERSVVEWGERALRRWLEANLTE